jgi:two-component system, OmpR family, sensor kinase
VTERERTAINEALHELRRPLQALALCGAGSSDGEAVASSTRLAAVALERLEREVNGGGCELPEELVCGEPVLRSAVGRWRAAAARAGGSLELRWRGGDATVIGDGAALEQTVDNLIVNAIEHGGPAIVVEGRCRGTRLTISVADSGRRSRPRPRAGGTARPFGRISAAGRRGYGLSIVRRFAASHGGRFVLQAAAGGSVAVLELPLVVGRPAADLAA